MIANTFLTALGREDAVSLDSAGMAPAFRALEKD